MTTSTGNTMYGWAVDMFPFCRSITGGGVRQTLAYLKRHLPGLAVHEVPSGTKVFDWTVPDEWNISDAYVADGKGNRIIDFKKHNLHVAGYSEPVDRVVDLEELDRHLHSLPDQPDAIPYVTYYFSRNWGFCLAHNQRRALTPGKYHVKIDSSLKKGHLTYGEVIIPGRSKKEIFLSTYICHPSMANNELSGIVVTAMLADFIGKQRDRRYSYRIVFVPETIGAIAYLSRNISKMKRNIIAGFLVNCVGDDHSFSFLPSRLGNTLSDRVASHVLKHRVKNYTAWSFLDRGSDERQYCAPGVDLPVVSIMRSRYATYPEYHTSLDDLDFISAKALEESYNIHRECMELLELNDVYRIKVLCEPQLGKRGLYHTYSTKETVVQDREIKDIVAYADGQHDLISIAETIGKYAGDITHIVKQLRDADLIEAV